MMFVPPVIYVVHAVPFFRENASVENAAPCLVFARHLFTVPPKGSVLLLPRSLHREAQFKVEHVAFDLGMDPVCTWVYAVADGENDREQADEVLDDILEVWPIHVPLCLRDNTLSEFHKILPSEFSLGRYSEMLNLDTWKFVTPGKPTKKGKRK